MAISSVTAQGYSPSVNQDKSADNIIKALEKQIENLKSRIEQVRINDKLDSKTKQQKIAELEKQIADIQGQISSEKAEEASRKTEKETEKANNKNAGSNEVKKAEDDSRSSETMNMMNDVNQLGVLFKVKKSLIVERNRTINEPSQSLEGPKYSEGDIENIKKKSVKISDTDRKIKDKFRELSHKVKNSADEGINAVRVSGSSEGAINSEDTSHTEVDVNDNKENKKVKFNSREEENKVINFDTYA
ncbi:FlxA-like family protein [Clostridium sp. 19966]|uniref:FlxA-like family protein n=1 Tax=Clostridium sp. 19966 TaxID=2768166 RepID=UPI0028DF917E|nr:FlxA-like family protein [Clostridium sp. 19966]MDT8717218.1 FlxA-like family protein [Clostridium sp. 19966]